MTDQPAASAGAPVKERATDAAQAAKDAGTDVARTAASQAKDVVQESSKQTRDLIGEAREQAWRQAGAQHRTLVDNLRSLDDELGGMTDRSKQQSGVGVEMVGQARHRVRGAADWLEAREPGDLLDEIRLFAGRRPGAFLLGAAMAGVVAGRLTRGLAATQSHDNSGATSAIQDMTGAADAPRPGPVHDREVQP